MENEIKHLEYFKIENFKNLDNFELDDIRQFNIILGDNDVGKTNLLEALLFDEKLSIYLDNLLTVLGNRFFLNSRDFNDVDYINFYLNYYSNSRDIKHSYKYNNSNIINTISLGAKVIHELDSNELNQFKKNTTVFKERPTYALIYILNNKKYVSSYKSELGMINELDYMPYIHSLFNYAEDLVSFYSKNIVPSKTLKKEFIENLKILIPDLDDFQVSSSSIPGKSILMFGLKGKDKLIPVALEGGGTIRLIRIILEITMCKNNRLMIDEIDNGIHYSHMKDILKIIYKVADINNVQIFASTHNRECLRFLKEVLNDEDMKKYQDKSRSYTMKKLPDNRIEAFKYNFEEFEYAVNSDIELRGGIR